MLQLSDLQRVGYKEYPFIVPIYYQYAPVPSLQWGIAKFTHYEDAKVWIEHQRWYISKGRVRGRPMMILKVKNHENG